MSSYGKALPAERVHVIKYSELKTTVSDIKKQGRELSVMIGLGHGAIRSMTSVADGRKAVGLISNDAGLAEGGAFISLACGTCTDAMNFPRFEKAGTHFAGFSGQVYPQPDGSIYYEPADELGNPRGKDFVHTTAAGMIPTHGTMPKNKRVDSLTYDTVLAVEGDEPFQRLEMRKRQKARIERDSKDVPKR